MTELDPGRKTLVTGGAGFIGSHLVESLIARGDDVVVIDDFSTGRRENLEHADPEHLEIIEARALDAICAFELGAFDEIYHLAAAVGVRLVVEQPIHTIRTNIDETIAVLEYASATATPTLLASTSEVYGKSTKTPFREDDDVVFGPTIYSRWSYACSKAIDEYLALAHYAEHELPIVIARFFNTVGPRQIGRWGMVLPRFVAAALEGRDLEVYGDGTQSRCFCDVRDVVAVLPRMVGNPDCAGSVYNVGSDEVITIRGLAELVVATLGSSSGIVTIPYEDVFGRGFDDLLVRQPDLTRLRDAIGFETHIPLEQTIRDVAANLRSDVGSAA